MWHIDLAIILRGTLYVTRRLRTPNVCMGQLHRRALPIANWSLRLEWSFVEIVNRSHQSGDTADRTRRRHGDTPILVTGGIVYIRILITLLISCLVNVPFLVSVG